MNPEPPRCGTAPRVAVAIRAVEPVLAETSPRQAADPTAIPGRIRGRAIRLAHRARPLAGGTWLPVLASVPETGCAR